MEIGEFETPDRMTLVSLCNQIRQMIFQSTRGNVDNGDILLSLINFLAYEEASLPKNRGHHRCTGSRDARYDDRSLGIAIRSVGGVTAPKNEPIIQTCIGNHNVLFLPRR